jgi:lantibiotic biosynthesis protein
VIQTPAAIERSAFSAGRYEPRDFSLAGGSAGLAVFFAYLFQSDRRSRYRNAAVHYLRDTTEALESVTMRPALYDGFTGATWARAHLEGILFGAGEEGSTEAVDAALNGYLNRPRWQGDYDLVNGLVGLGVYALERLPAPVATSCLEGVVDRLAETAKRRPEGVTWHTSPDRLPPPHLKLCPRGYDNLGLAHGVPGIVAILAAACAAGIRRRKARRLLDDAVEWLLRRKLKRSPGARFPAWTAPGTRGDPCRSAWCYGDPGVAVSLFWAARSVGEPAWEREAVEIAREAAKRTPDQAGVVDAGLCHGAAGLGHIFNRMSQATGDATLRRAARYWIERALAMRQEGRGIGGFSALSARDDGTRYWEDDPGLLMGSAGIGLAFLAATTSVEPEWDRMLLVSARTGRPSTRRSSGRSAPQNETLQDRTRVAK